MGLQVGSLVRKKSNGKVVMIESIHYSGNKVINLELSDETSDTLDNLEINLKVYIAGKINGLLNYRSVFGEVQSKLENQGHSVMSPAVLGEGFNYNVYMPICLAMLEACDVVYMLSNWVDSRGAKVEHEYAKLQGKSIYYEGGM